MTKKSKYTDLRPFSNGLALVHRDDKAGYINTSGEEVIECRFCYAGNFNDLGYAVVEDEKGQQGVIDRSGNYVVQPKYNAIDLIDNTSLISAETWMNLKPNQFVSSQLINLEKGNKILGTFNFIDTQGISSKENNQFVPVRHAAGKWSIMNGSGELMMPFKYDSIECSYESIKHSYYGRCENEITGDYFIARFGGKDVSESWRGIFYSGGKYGLITSQGDVVLDFKYDELWYVSDDCIIIGKGKMIGKRKFGVITLTGKTILPCKYSHVYVSENIICFEDWDSKKCGWADMQGNILVEPRLYLYAYRGFDEGLLRVRQQHFGYTGKVKVGFVNKEGDLAIPFKFDIRKKAPFTKIENFHNGLAAYGIDVDGLNAKYGWIDKNGDFVIPPIYHTDFTRFGEEGLVPVRLGDEHFYIDRTGTRCLF